LSPGVDRLFSYPAEFQLQVLDQLNTAGFKVMYEVGQQLDDCDDPLWYKNHKELPICFNVSSKLEWLAERIALVKDHPALLGCLSTPATTSP
jgi:hypothetical protein